MPRKRREKTAADYRSDAYYAYLDGRTAYAKKLNRKADDLDRRLRLLAAAQPKTPVQP